MIRTITKKDLLAIEKITSKELVNRNDVNFELSGISVENNIIDSVTIIGCQSLTDFFNGNLPSDLAEIEELGSQEIIAVYSADNTSETLWKTYGKYAHHVE